LTRAVTHPRPARTRRAASRRTRDPALELVCPTCQAALARRRAALVCTACDQSYSVVDGIARFVGEVPDGQRQVQGAFDYEHRQYRDSSYLTFGEARVNEWLRYTGLGPDYFRNKLVLDAGCGTGRWTDAMARLGATVVAVDITESGARLTRKLTRGHRGVEVLQADIMHLPFAPSSFDFVASWGVLHHTPSTERALARLVPLVRPGGHLYVMVYEWHNPVKFWLTDALRALLRRLPNEQRYRACRRLIIENPALYARIGRWLLCAAHPGIDNEHALTTVQLGLYDAYSPRYNHLHTRHEVLRWFSKYGFEEIELTQPVIHPRGRNRFFLGECGGAVHVRGRRSTPLARAAV
jgi:SAM-dependent methyltransferase